MLQNNEKHIEDDFQKDEIQENQKRIDNKEFDLWLANQKVWMWKALKVQFFIRNIIIIEKLKENNMENLENYNLFITHKTRAVKLNAEEQKKYLLVEAKKQKDIKFDDIQFDVKKATDKYILIKLTTFANKFSKVKSYLQYLFCGETLTIKEGFEGVESQYVFNYGNGYTQEDLKELEQKEQKRK